MQRRQFIRNMGLAGLSNSLVGKALASDVCCTLHGPAVDAPGGIPSLKLLQSFSLTEFHDEQEEGPCMVCNGVGGEWLFSLRRLPYPDSTEHVSCFSHVNGVWQEQDPVTLEEGQYEAITASCSLKGEPVVAWSCKEMDRWTIMVSRKTGSGFGRPHTFRGKSGRCINPVLISPRPNRDWIAWECYEDGCFSIQFSKYADGSWTSPVKLTESGKSLMHPAMAEGIDGTLFLAYSITDGVHQNIEMKRINGTSLEVLETIPVAIGGGLRDRVNLNTNPDIAFDHEQRLWISWENNRKISREDVGDNFTGNMICAVVCYHHGRIMESKEQGKWLFDGINDHLPAFVKDNCGNLFLVTRCGGDFEGNPYWKYRLSSLHPEIGWTQPEIFYATDQKGEASRPALIFDSQGHFWMAARMEKRFVGEAQAGQFQEGAIRVLASKLELHQFIAPQIKQAPSMIKLQDTQVEEHHPVRDFVPAFSGRPRIPRKKITYKGDTYTLLLGNLHEHTENSPCWPAGCDGTLDENYRFGLLSEGYDFMGITDHGYSLTEVYWRKNLRLAEFYTDRDHFVAVPAMEWTLSNQGSAEIKFGVGHKNVIFPSTGEALKFIRNKHEIISRDSPETSNAEILWSYLHKEKIDCVTIPHHPASAFHTTDWNVHDPYYETVVEIFQRRGNAEHQDCPRLINYPSYKPSPDRRAYIDYALRDKQYRMGFIASGDHTGIGVGLAALWVREISREGIVEALKNRRCFATTGDKIFVDFRVNGAWGGDVTRLSGSFPEMTFQIEAVNPIQSVEILRNSRIVHSMPVKKNSLQFEGSFTDREFQKGDASTYYYLRVTQQNKHIAWSSPVWIE